MGSFIANLMNSMAFLWVQKILIVTLFIVFLCYFFSKEGRDERGRAIIGTASFFAMAALFVAVNVYSMFTYTLMDSNVVEFSNAMCLVATVFEVVEIAAISILRKIR